MNNHSDSHRGRGRHRHRRRMFHTFENDGAKLGPRLSYLTMLMRRSDTTGPQGTHGRPGGLRGQGRVLHVLGIRSPMSQKELAYVLGIRSQSLAELVGKLEAADLVSRRPDPKDGRTHLVELTDAGRSSVETQGKNAPVNPFETLSDEESEQLALILDKAIDHMESSLPGGPDPRMLRFKEMTFAPSAFEQPTDQPDSGPHPNRPAM